MFAQPLGLLASGLRVLRAQFLPQPSLARAAFGGNRRFLALAEAWQ